MTEPASDRAPWTFNKDYNDTEQVRPFFADFLSVYHDIKDRWAYPYNSSFKGRIPGLATATSRDEDTAIYLLQTLKELDALKARVQSALTEGFQPLDSLREPRRYARVVEYGFYMGGTGWREWADARVVPYGPNRRMILPKGKRTNGHLPNGHLLVAEQPDRSKAQQGAPRHRPRPTDSTPPPSATRSAP